MSLRVDQKVTAAACLYCNERVRYVPRGTVGTILSAEHPVYEVEFPIEKFRRSKGRYSRRVIIDWFSQEELKEL